MQSMQSMQSIRPILISLMLLHGSAAVYAIETESNAPAQEQAAAQDATRTVHTVLEGETLADIARQYYNTERQLRYHNLIPDAEGVSEGQQLRIPEPTLRVPGNWQKLYAQGLLPGQEFAAHEVKRGETLSLIARSYDLKPELLQRLNDLDNPDALEVGDRLRLPEGAQMKRPVAVSTVRPIAVTRDTPIGVYTVARGDTLSLIAERHGVRVGHILTVNPLPDPNRLEIGDRLLVPDPHRRLPPAEPPSEYTFMWPLDDYEVVSEYGGRGGREHRGVDMAAAAGSPIRAAADGTVVYSGEQRGYGKVVVIDHGDGIETLYAHNTRNLVKRGQDVLQGQMIATVGDTGNAKGHHLHFEYIVDGDSKEPREHIETVRRGEG